MLLSKPRHQIVCCGIMFVLLCVSPIYISYSGLSDLIHYEIIGFYGEKKRFWKRTLCYAIKWIQCYTLNLMIEREDHKVHQRMLSSHCYTNSLSLWDLILCETNIHHYQKLNSFTKQCYSFHCFIRLVCLPNTN